MNKKLLDILLCPESKMPLLYDKKVQELVCVQSGLAYPVRDGIPVLLVDQARKLSEDELQKHRKQ